MLKKASPDYPTTPITFGMWPGLGFSEAPTPMEKLLEWETWHHVRVAGGHLSFGVGSEAALERRIRG